MSGTGHMTEDHASAAVLPPFDPIDGRLYVDPYPVFAAYRQHDPVHWGLAAHPDIDGAWYLFRYDDCLEGLHDRRLVLDPGAVGRELSVPAVFRPIAELMSRFLGAIDPPEHARMRLLLHKAFTPRRVAALRPRVEQITAELLARPARAGAARFDLIAAFAFPLPIAVIGEILGVPPSDQHSFRELSTRVVNANDNPNDAGAVEVGAQAAGEMVDYFAELVEAKRRDPGDDFLTAMVTAEEAGVMPFSHDELIAIAIELLIAGHETTVNALAKGTIGLLTQRGQYELLASDPERYRVSAVEEILRWTSPLQRTRNRWATEDIEIRGRRLRRGDPVFLLPAAANRDPAQFPDPDRIDIGRNEGLHLSFGHGIHYCLGQALARLEIEIAFGALARTYPALELDATFPLSWRPNSMLPGPAQVFVLADNSSPTTLSES